MTSTPGHDLDALVAERVMGWTGREHELWTDANGEVTPWGTEFCHFATTSLFFRPSMEIDAAWRVVEEMHKKGYSLMLDYLGAEGWAVTFKHDGTFPEAEAVEKTAPLAISLAALSTMIKSQAPRLGEK